MKVIDFIGQEVEYDEMGQQIRAINNGSYQLIADIRGWGAIQNLPEFKNSQKSAGEFKHELGEWITDAINSKLKLERIASKSKLGIKPKCPNCNSDDIDTSQEVSNMCNGCNSLIIR